MAGVADRPLDVEHRPQPLEGLEGPPRQLEVRDADDPPPLRAEERLDHHVAPQRLEGRQRLGRRFAHPGRRHGQPRRVEQGQRQVLVDRRLDRAGGLSTGTPPAATRCKASIRKTTCSRLPGGIIRTSTPSTPDRSIPPPAPAASPVPTWPDHAGNGTASSVSPSRPAARRRSWTCQPKPETRATNLNMAGVDRDDDRTRTEDRPSDGGHGSREERPDEDVGGRLAEGVDAAGLEVLEDDLGRAEQVGIDGVEVVVVAGEDRREGLAVVARGGRGDLAGRSPSGWRRRR